MEYRVFLVHGEMEGSSGGRGKNMLCLYRLAPGLGATNGKIFGYVAVQILGLYEWSPFVLYSLD
jgi:hypothetical protein